jgi:hypothetical protein
VETESVMYQLNFTSSKNIDPCQSYSWSKIRAYVGPSAAYRAQFPGQITEIMESRHNDTDNPSTQQTWYALAPQWGIVWECGNRLLTIRFLHVLSGGVIQIQGFNIDYCPIKRPAFWKNPNKFHNLILWFEKQKWIMWKFFKLSDEGVPLSTLPGHILFSICMLYLKK